ncbi:ATP-binding cassette domain-containing protein [Lawsonia intracellularis]|uniref:ATPase components of ABC transporters with duplicated ATPase domains n=1 Tax=Lawsonia intracellularis (strain PHE/MN1-00) TaxID=363253 RepID=Q1MRG4_LAWIP|nr:ABC-F family ATP-binding cassette domain-containing protein [Lawsonia intracellularis]AGC49771.1 ABC transporter [Lawsonia intracellularis N343]KAA0205276.1 ABC transporter ATP-binding protein [Lawsonia intracellularis]MBZ3892193.1 ATP-binding cassette domain-containing protein [Lawsonia intracellularis]OMQ04539.1 ABC transporter ATP-binding protein [Lawsonia intracellularis]RBN32177.1 ABC transporter ATP-binding protein [Lawsonia intracellularis]
MKITIQNFSKSFGGQDIFSDFSLDIDSGIRLCVSGPNGCGKSTLLRIIAEVDIPDSGRVIIPKGTRIGYVEQELAPSALDVSLLTWVLEVLPDWHDFWATWEEAIQANDSKKLSELSLKHTELETLYGYHPEYKAKEILSGLGFTDNMFDLPLSKLSGGWRERAKLARVLVAGADVLLLDEPTNHLDIESVEWLEEFLREYKGILIFVAHDRVFMDNVGTHILYLGGLKPVFRKLTFSQFMVLREEIEEQKARETQRITDEIERKMEFVRRFGAKATKARQASSRQKMAKKLEQELEEYKPEIKRKELKFIWPTPLKADKVILSAAALSFSFPDGRQLWPSLTFSLLNGQRIALVGPNGCGKSTLLKIIAGQLKSTGGSLTLGSGVRLGYYSQHQTEILNTSGTVLGEIRRLSDPKMTEEELMSVLGLFLLGQGYFDRTIQMLSGGEKARLVLASLFLNKANFLVLDEPTNHLDLESREALVNALSNFSGTLLVVAHDRYLCSNVTDEAWALSSEGLTRYEQGFLQYDEARKQGLKQVTIVETQDNQKNCLTQKNKKNSVISYSRDELKSLKREQAKKRNELYNTIKPKQIAYKRLEEELSILLEKQHNLEQLLATPAGHGSGIETAKLLKQFSEVKDQTDRIIDKLEKLELEINALEQQRIAIS